MRERRSQRRVSAAGATTIAVAEGQYEALLADPYGSTSTGEQPENFTTSLAEHLGSEVVVASLQGSLARAYVTCAPYAKPGVVDVILSDYQGHHAKVQWRRPPPVSIAASASATAYTVGTGEVVLREAALVTDILREIAIEPVEDGIAHVAEHLLAEFLIQSGSLRLRASLPDIIRGKSGADFVKLLGRSSDIDMDTRRLIAEHALDSLNVDVRDAAVQAVENWGDRRLASSLNSHHDSVPWLAEYVARVIKALEA